MKKLISCACLAALLLTGCTANVSSQNSNVTSNEVENQPGFIRNGNTISAKRQNLYTMNFLDLQDAIKKAISGESGKIAMPFMSELPPADIYFLPDGQILQFDMSLWSLVREDSREFILTKYNIESNTENGIISTQAPMLFNIYPDDIWQNENLMKQGFEEMFSFDKFPFFMQWAYDFDFESVIHDYVPGEPTMYELIANAEIQKDVINTEGVNCIFLDCSSDTPREVAYADLPEMFPSMIYDADGQTQTLDYFVILPHYPAENMKGYSPLFVCASPQSSESGFCFYSPEAKAIKDENYVINNAIILFPHGIKPLKG